MAFSKKILLKQLVMSSQEKNLCHSWNCWRKNNKDVAINLTSLLFENLNLEGIDLESYSKLQINLAYSIFKKVDFLHSKLSHTILSCTQLEKVSVANSQLTNVDFCSSSMLSVKFCNLDANQCDFSSCNMQNVIFENVQFSSTIFSASEICDSFFVKCSFKSTFLEDAYLTNTKFINCQVLHG